MADKIDEAFVLAKLMCLVQECTFENVDNYFMTRYDLEVKRKQPKSSTQTQEDGTKITFNPIKVYLLFSQLPLAPLNRVRVGKSMLHRQGVFANQDIKAFEIVTFYPADVVLCHSKTNDDSLCMFSTAFQKKFSSVAEQTKECLDCVDKIFDLSPSISIQAHPLIHDGSNNNFLGHFINDGCVKDPFSVSEEEYIAQVMMTTNCKMKATKNGLCLPVIALKDIHAGQELTTCYGYRYWQQQKAFRIKLSIK